MNELMMNELMLQAMIAIWLPRVITVWLVCAVLSTIVAWAGLKHDRALTGFMLGLLLGPIGVLVTLLLRISWSINDSRDTQSELLRALLAEQELQR